MNGPELRDIHLPDAVSWWPPAPGWWLLLALVLLAAIGGYCWRRWRRSTRRRTIAELGRLRQHWQDGRGEREVIDGVAALLRRTLICYRGRAGFAASSGEQWLAQLRELGPIDERVLAWLGEARYRRRLDCDIDQLIDASENWIKSLPTERSRVSA